MKIDRETSIQMVLSSLALVRNQSDPTTGVKALDPKIYKPYLETYQSTSGDLIVIGRSVLRCFEPNTAGSRQLILSLVGRYLIDREN